MKKFESFIFCCIFAVQKLIDMEFKTQICTTKEQSERLLGLGLNPDTADMGLVGDIPIILNTLWKNADPIFETPAWSLHRLIEIYRESINASDYLFEGDAFEKAISNIEWLIKKDYINKEYIE